MAAGDRFLLRRSSGQDRAVGGIVLDVTRARGISRRRQTVDRVAHLAAAVDRADPNGVAEALIDLQGAGERDAGTLVLATDVDAALAAFVLASFDRTPV